MMLLEIKLNRRKITVKTMLIIDIIFIMMTMIQLTISMILKEENSKKKLQIISKEVRTIVITFLILQWITMEVNRK